MVASDWGAVKEKKEKAIAAGLDIILTGPNNMEDCVIAVEEGIISEEDLNDHVYRILKLICDLKAE